MLKIKTIKKLSFLAHQATTHTSVLAIGFLSFLSANQSVLHTLHETHKEPQAIVPVSAEKETFHRHAAYDSFRVPNPISGSL